MASGRFDAYNYKNASAKIEDGRQHYDEEDRTDWTKVSTSAFTYRFGIVYLPVPEHDVFFVRRDLDSIEIVAFGVKA